ncbi:MULTISPECIES: DUF3618 domain-containing protein [Actinomycetes]|uniref:DUF3618 domain-containing protein n=1 Tax=Actinomycetes TaxID=1760 RepID=UPI0035CC598A
MAGSSSGRPDRDKDQIEADLAATRDRLTGALESLIDQVHPQRIKQREIAGAKRFVSTEIENAKSLVYNARGDLRTDRLAVLGGAAAGLVSLVVVLRAVARRRRG